MSDLSKLLEEMRSLVDGALDKYLPLETAGPSRDLHKAMRYAVFPGGKRIRPVMTFLVVESLGSSRMAAIRPACAIELIHSYSLIHDDLPCMDDDDERRGRPTVHRAFGEDIAVLAGDALLSLAFETLSSQEAQNDLGSSLCTLLISEIARASGSTGMVGGQAMEIDFRRRGRMSLDDSCGIKHLESLARLKTGALFVASVRCGALVAGATHDQLSMLTRFAENIGLAFQIVDDILDQDKDLGQSQQPGESPWPASFSDILDTKDARKYATELTRAGLDAIEILGAKADPLRQLTMELLERAG